MLTEHANIAFQVKILLLLAAGANMLAFHFFTYRGVARWVGDRFGVTWQLNLP